VRLEAMSAVVRPRTAWQSIDLGFRLVRAHYPVMLKCSFAVVTPCFLLCQFVFAAYPIATGIAFWWLKPIWERVHLYILSRSLFGEPPDASEALRAFPQYAFKQVLLSLTIRRFSTTRSLDLPVVMLEGLEGRARARRLGVLRRGDTSTGATWLTIVGAHVEIFLALAFATLIQLLVPETVEFDVFGSVLNSGGYWAGRAADAVSAVVGALVAPFYVGAGFALYINRRTILEGWDIEIAFRRLAERIETRDDRDRGALQPPQEAAVPVARRSVGSTVAVLLALLIAGAGPATPCRADTSARELGPREAREAVEATLSRDEFHDYEVFDIPRIVPRSGESAGDFVQWLAKTLAWLLDGEEEEASPLPEWFTDAIEDLFRFVSGSMEFLILLLVILGGFFVLGRQGVLSGWARTLRDGDPIRRLQPPQSLMGMDIREENLPGDVASEALSLSRRGRERAAISLLYRASLTHLTIRGSVRFRSGDTERDCLRAVIGKVDGDCEDFFRTLTHHREASAYAHRTPGSDAIASLCSAWPRHFDTGSKSEARDAT